jgi:hypothetical protein
MSMNVDDVRSRVQAISDRAKQDPDYQRQVIEDPAAALRSAGLPESTIGEVVSDWTRGSGEEVGAYRMCSWTCLGTTCDDKTTC